MDRGSDGDPVESELPFSLISGVWSMSARHKLNQAYFNGAIAFAILVGLCFQSLGAFALTATVLLLSACYVGDIRSTGHATRPTSRTNRRHRH